MKRDAISWDLEHNHLSSLCTSPLLLVVLQLLAASSTVCIYTLLLQNVVYDYPNWVTVLKQNISAIRGKYYRCDVRIQGEVTQNRPTVMKVVWFLHFKTRYFFIMCTGPTVLWTSYVHVPMICNKLRILARHKALYLSHNSSFFCKTACQASARPPASCPTTDPKSNGVWAAVRKCRWRTTFRKPIQVRCNVS